MKLEDNKEKIDKFFDSKSKEGLQGLWQKYSPKLEQNEAIVKDFIIHGSTCIGAQKTKTDVMISFTKLQEEFDYFDLFFSREKTIELRDKLTQFIETEL